MRRETPNFNMEWVRKLHNIEFLNPETWEQVPDEQVKEGVSRRTISTDRIMVVRYVYAPGSTFPVHSHPEEQIVLVLEGKLVFRTDGGELPMEAGSILAIPGGVPHEAWVEGSETVVSINIFNPPKKEFIK